MHGSKHENVRYGIVSPAQEKALGKEERRGSVHGHSPQVSLSSSGGRKQWRLPLTAPPVQT